MEYEVDDNRALRISVLHPEPAEAKIGADLIYEFHDLIEETVRVAFVQYKMWEREELPQEQRMMGQLDRLMGIGCRGQLCLSPGGNHHQDTYRLPYCCAFLRPTDRLQDPDATLISIGLHIPLCVVARSWEETKRGGKILRKTTVEKEAVTQAIFEYLFITAFLGSREIAIQELEGYYRDWGMLEDNDSIILHAQEFAK